MGTIEETVEFSAAPEKVWAVASDPARFGEWLGMHQSWKGETPTEFVKGTQATAIVSLLNMPNTITWTVAEYEPAKKVKLTGTGMAGVKVAIGLDVEPNATGGTTMLIRAEFEGQMIVGAIGQAIEKAGRAELDSSLAKLGELVA
jgi:uncharacterized protein YndB with AHSA1/START domain